MLDLVEEALDQIAVLVDVLVVGDGLRSRPGRWNDGSAAGVRDAGAKPIGVIAFVGQEMFEGNAADQVLGLHLAAGEDEANGVAERVHARADLGPQTAARTPDRLILAPP